MFHHRVGCDAHRRGSQLAVLDHDGQPAVRLADLPKQRDNRQGDGQKAANKSRKRSASSEGVAKEDKSDNESDNAHQEHRVRISPSCQKKYQRYSSRSCPVRQAFLFHGALLLATWPDGPGYRPTRGMTTSALGGL